jgi:large subunit ribosomal protein L31e
MAEKKKESKKVEKIERDYIVPLRKQVLKSPKYKRSKKAVDTLRIFLKKHMKCEDVKIGKNLNEFIWNRGIKNPPHKVEVHVVKTEDNQVLAELKGFTYVVKKKEEKKEKSRLEEAAEKMGFKAGKEGKKEKTEEILKEKEKEARDKEEPSKEEVKKEKEEIKEMKEEFKDLTKKTEKKEVHHEPDMGYKTAHGSQKSGQHEHSK